MQSKLWMQCLLAFSTWPRLESIAKDTWLQSEAYFYSAVRDGCAKSLKHLQGSVDNATIDRVLQDTHQISKHVLLVRSQELALHSDCINWTSSRIDMLQPPEIPQDQPDPSAWPPTHEEL